MLIGVRTGLLSAKEAKMKRKEFVAQKKFSTVKDFYVFMRDVAGISGAHKAFVKANPDFNTLNEVISGMINPGYGGAYKYSPKTTGSNDIIGTTPLTSGTTAAAAAKAGDVFYVYDFDAGDWVYE